MQRNLPPHKNQNKMIKTVLSLSLITLFTCCVNQSPKQHNIVTTDIENFWVAYDKIVSTEDSALQYKLLDSLYYKKGTAGLHAMIQAKNYTPQDYISAINNYPKFWNAVRENTLKANDFSTDLQEGIEKLRAIYPHLKPAKMYFTIGALRSNGTTLDSLVLIGSELAMTDQNTPSDEFPGEIGVNRRIYFDSNPINNLVLLNVHEYVHTQQNPAADNLLSYVIREGIAEFISVKAMGVASVTPAIAYGKQNDEVRKTFEREMFYGINFYQWLWGDAPNNFGVRDLGYYIGYELSERYFEQATDKNAAIKKLIELDYTNETEIENFVNSTGFFSAPLEELYQDFEAKRPTVIGIKQFENFSQNVPVTTRQITLEFSEPMNQDFTNFDYGPLGEEAAMRIKNVVGFSESGKLLTIEIEDLAPNKQYQLLVDWRFRNVKNMPLKAYLIDFKTTEK